MKKVFQRFLLLGLCFALFACASEPERSTRVLTLEPESIASITIARQGSEPYTISLQPDNDASSDNFYDSRKLNILRQQVATVPLTDGFEASGADLATYGLEKPELTATFFLADGSVQLLHFGNYSTFAQKRYLRPGQSEYVYLAPEILYQNLSKERMYYFDPRLVQFSIPNTCELVVTGPTVTLHFKKDLAAGWLQILGSETQAADGAAVEAVLANMQFLKSREQVTETKEFAYTITVTSCAAEQMQVSLSDIRRDAFDIESESIRVAVSSRPGRVYEVARRDAPVLFPEAVSFRRQRPFAVELAAIAEAQFLHESDPRIFRRSDNAWTVNGREADAPFVIAALRAFLEIEVVRYLSKNNTSDTAAWQLTATQPLLAIRLLDRSGVTQLDASIWRLPDTRSYVAWNSRFKELFQLDESVMRKVFPSLEVFVPAE